MKASAILDLEEIFGMVRKPMPRKPPKVEQPKKGRGAYKRRAKHAHGHQ